MGKYPNDKHLMKIEQWDLTKGDVMELIDYINEIWNWSDRGVIIKKCKKELKLELHTGGWSGNEEIVGALERNPLFFHFFWEKSVRGGHYYFKIPLVKIKIYKHS